MGLDVLSTLYADVLVQEGFQLIGQLSHRLHLTIWWNPQQSIQLIVLSIGSSNLIKGDKSYYLKSVSPDGETWARDVTLLHDWLEGHFPELRISFSHFRDVPAGLAEAEVHRRMAVEAPTLPMPTPEQIAQLQAQLRTKQQDVQATDAMMTLLNT